MTKVVVTRKNKHIVSVEADGHTCYGAKGEDIVCAALSSVLQTAVLGIMRVAGIDAKYVIGDELGSLKLYLPEEMSDEDRRNADMILDTMLLGVADLNEGYSDFIELEVK